MLTLIYLLLFIIVLCVLASFLYYKYDMAKMKNIPGPYPLPIIGNGHKFLGTSFQFIQALSDFMDTYGEIVRIYIAADRFMVISNPKYIEAIIANTDFITKSISYSYLYPWLGQGLLTATGHRWYAHRKLLTGAFHFNILKTFLPIFTKNDVIVTEKLRAVADGKPVDIFPIMALVALDNISEAAMGVSVNALQDSESEYVTTVNKYSVLLFDRMKHPILGINAIFNFLPLKTTHNKALDILHRFTKKVIEDRKKVLEESNTTLENYEATTIGIKKKSAFLDLLLLSEVDGKKLDINTIREEVDTFMFEGHDTTTSGLSFCLYCLSQNKHAQEKVYEELKDILGDDVMKQPDYNDMSNMKYLEMVIKESLRMFPSVPLIGRLITKDTKIGDYFIPKDTNMTVHIMKMQRSVELYGDPMVFRPERFENISTEQKNAYSFLAFSAGPRNCIGQKFAMLEMKTVISSIIRKFHLLPSDIEPRLSADIILRSENGVHVRLLPRNQ